MNGDVDTEQNPYTHDEKFNQHYDDLLNQIINAKSLPSFNEQKLQAESGEQSSPPEFERNNDVDQEFQYVNLPPLQDAQIETPQASSQCNTLQDPDKSRSVSGCEVCQKKFGLMNGQKYCKGCGQIVCGSCSKRKRPHPENPEIFIRVCDICHGQTISDYIRSRFTDKDQRLDLIKEKVAKRSEYISDLLLQQNIKFDHLQSENDRDNHLFIYKSEKLSKEIQTYQINLKNIEKQGRIMEQTIIQLKEAISKEETQKEEELQGCQELQDKLQIIENDIDHLLLQRENIQKRYLERQKLKDGNKDSLMIPTQNRSIFYSTHSQSYVKVDQQPPRGKQKDTRDNIKNSELFASQAFSDWTVEDKDNAKASMIGANQHIIEKIKKNKKDSALSSHSQEPCCQIF